MINRTLIRIKVIQVLYSFLLVEKHFSIESQPTAPTKEKRFAYSLYQDMLVLLVKLALNIQRRGGDRPLAETAFMSRLMRDDDVKALLRKYQDQLFPFDSLIQELSDKIRNSSVYKGFLKDSGNEIGAGQENLWQNLFSMVIMTDGRLNELISQRKDFTLRAVERTKEMVARTFVNFLASQDNVHEIEKTLQTSLDKARELYLRLLYLPVELTDLEERIIDENRHKFIKTENDINPNLRFVENRIVKALRDNAELTSRFAVKNDTWYNQDPLMLRNLLKAVKESEVYTDYMQSGDTGIRADSEFWRAVFRKVILNNPDFLAFLEDKSVFWNDDLETMSTFVFKSFRRLEEGDTASAVLDKFKDEEDEKFGNELVRSVHKDKDFILGYIEDILAGSNWEQDRLAFMDLVIMETALAEILNFPKIPIRASFNEYIELAKSYSSAKSGQFVHAILGAVIEKMQKDGRLLK